MSTEPIVVEPDEEEEELEVSSSEEEEEESSSSEDTRLSCSKCQYVIPYDHEAACAHCRGDVCQPDFSNFECSDNCDECGKVICKRCTYGHAGVCKGRPVEQWAEDHQVEVGRPTMCAVCHDAIHDEDPFDACDVCGCGLCAEPTCMFKCAACDTKMCKVCLGNAHMCGEEMVHSRMAFAGPAEVSRKRSSPASPVVEDEQGAGKRIRDGPPIQSHITWEPRSAALRGSYAHRLCEILRADEWAVTSTTNGVLTYALRPFLPPDGWDNMIGVAYRHGLCRIVDLIIGNGVCEYTNVEDLESMVRGLPVGDGVKSCKIYIPRMV